MNGQPGQCNVTCTALIPPGGACTQTFTGTLRYGQKHSFSDSISNVSGFDLGLEKFSYQSIEENDFNQSASFPEFEWTSQFVADGFLVKNGTRNLKIVQTKA
jgi:hypothetical protein